MKFRIGELSYLTSLSVKALRLYHEKGLLEPAAVDDASGYRYYDERSLETARCISALKEFDFSLAEIKALLDGCTDESDMVGQLEAKLREV